MSPGPARESDSSFKVAVALGVLLLAVPLSLGTWFVWASHGVEKRLNREIHGRRSETSAEEPAGDRNGKGPASEPARDLDRAPPKGAQEQIGDRLEKPSPVPHPDDVSIARFDANADKFERLVGAFEAELEHSFNPELSSSVERNLAADFAALVPSATTRARCTETACVVEVTSDVRVGTLLARLSSWKLKHDEVALGNPKERDDERSLRFVFDRADAAGFVAEQQLKK